MLRSLLKPAAFIIFLFTGVCLKAQINGIVIEKETQIPIAFVSVTYGNKTSQKGTITDVNGRFKIEDASIKDLTFSCIGYKSVQIEVKHSDKNITIELVKDTVTIGEVIVMASQNPAIPIIRKALKNKSINNFETYKSYRFNCYFKTIGDVKLSKKAKNADSVYLSDNKGIKNSALLISELGVQFTKQNNRYENCIFASKMSGFRACFEIKLLPIKLFDLI